MVGGEGLGSRSEGPGPGPHSALHSPGTSGRLLSLSGPQFAHLYKGLIKHPLHWAWLE